ncbi:hypothetical protein ACFE04_031739 [Oxalis oulophora]
MERYRNVMDMNAGLGGFAVALESPKSWVMNVVPTTADNTLGVRVSLLIRGHMILFMLVVFFACTRTKGLVILRDGVEVLNKVKIITKGMRWDTKMIDHENGPFVPKKILIASKQFWVAAEGSNSSSDK